MSGERSCEGEQCPVWGSAGGGDWGLVSGDWIGLHTMVEVGCR